MGFLSDIKGKVTEIADQAKSGELAAKAKAAAETVAEKANEVAGEVKEKAAEFAEEHGSKVTEAVAKAGSFVDEKTGGKTAAVTGKLTEVADKAVSTVAAGAEHGVPAAPEAPEPTSAAESIPVETDHPQTPTTGYGTATFTTPAPEHPSEN